MPSTALESGLILWIILLNFGFKLKDPQFEPSCGHSPYFITLQKMIKMVNHFLIMASLVNQGKSVMV